MIQAFTKPGDLVLDPFMGGGTTLIEARTLGREVIGSDLNSLAVFLANAKTVLYTPKDLEAVRQWVHTFACSLDVHASQPLGEFELPELNGMQQLNTWRIRKAIGIALRDLKSLEASRARKLAKCVVLRTAQWALDCRSVVPSISDFKDHMKVAAKDMLKGASDFARAVRTSEKSLGYLPRVNCLNTSAASVHLQPIWKRHGAPALVLTSPPYPGVHVLYHRWQIRGRRETSVPFWISGTTDGNGAAFYTFGDRKQKNLAGYFQAVEENFAAVGEVCNSNTVIVQLIAFSEPEDQLPRYLAAMKQAGLREITVSSSRHKSGERIWRSVPNRKWYAEQKSTIGSASEVVLFHKKR
jgi:hypothetical protein